MRQIFFWPSPGLQHFFDWAVYIRGAEPVWFLSNLVLSLQSVINNPYNISVGCYIIVNSKNIIHVRALSLILIIKLLKIPITIKCNHKWMTQKPEAPKSPTNSYYKQVTYDFLPTNYPYCEAGIPLIIASSHIFTFIQIGICYTVVDQHYNIVLPHTLK